MKNYEVNVSITDIESGTRVDVRRRSDDPTWQWMANEALYALRGIGFEINSTYFFDTPPYKEDNS